MSRTHAFPPQLPHSAGLPPQTLAVAIVAAGLLVDPWSDAAFDAPKRFTCMLAITLAAGLWVAGLGPSPRAWRPAWTRGQWICAIAFVLTLLGGGLACALSPRPTLAFDALRVGLTFALLVPLGASHWLENGVGHRLAGVFVGVASVNAGIAVGERMGVLQLFPGATSAGRLPVHALLGNEGTLSLVFAFAALICVGAWITSDRSGRPRNTTVLGLALNAGGLAATGGLTAIIAFGAGGCVLLAAVSGRVRRRLGVAVIGLILVASAVPATRARLSAASDSLRAADWDRLTTYRLGAWVAAMEMAAARPVAGYGPGTFGAEFVEHRLRGELRYQRRFAPPHMMTSYAQAHNEYLHGLAETGFVVATTSLAALGSLIGGLFLRRRRAQAQTRALDAERWVILSVLVGGAVAALTWFPLQVPLSAILLLLCAGRGFRLLADAPPSRPVRPSASPAPALLGVSLLVAALWLWPEVRRLASEHELAAVTGGLRAEILQRSAPPSAARLKRIAAAARHASNDLPGDSRALIAAGSAELVAGRLDAALHDYCAALARGERSEIDLNLGRVLAKQDRRAAAFAAFLRATWINPELLAALPSAAQPLVQSETTRVEEALAAGRLSQPPPLPLDVCPPDTAASS